MCNPILIVGAAGVLASAYGVMKQQQASNDAADYQSQIAERNSQVANMQQDAAIAQGKSDKVELRERLQLVKGQQRAGYSGSGVMVDDGSALDALNDTTRSGELEALQIENNAARTAWSYGVSAGNYTAQSQMYQASKSSVSEAGATSLLSGTSRLATSYLMSSAK